MELPNPLVASQLAQENLARWGADPSFLNDGGPLRAPVVAEEAPALRPDVPMESPRRTTVPVADTLPDIGLYRRPRQNRGGMADAQRSTNSDLRTTLLRARAGLPETSEQSAVPAAHPARVVTRFLQAVQSDMDIFSQAYEANGDPAYLTALEGMHQHTAETLARLRLLQTTVEAPVAEMPPTSVAETRPQAALPRHKVEAAAGVRGLRRLLPQFLRRRKN
jgi:hypothetical protein